MTLSLTNKNALTTTLRLTSGFFLGPVGRVPFELILATGDFRPIIVRQRLDIRRNRIIH
jgi:hypothetical protein